MFPIILTTQQNRILMIGNGPATARRIALLKDAGMKFDHIRHPSEGWDPEMLDSCLRRNDGAYFNIVFIADFDEATSTKLYHQFKAQGALVNVEDITHLCDFHVPAIVRRSDLLLTVSTNAASPRLARRLRMMLEQLFPAVWAERLNLIRRKRTQWKAEGKSFSDIADKTDALLDAEGWLQADCECLRKSQP